MSMPSFFWPPAAAPYGTRILPLIGQARRGGGVAGTVTLDSAAAGVAAGLSGVGWPVAAGAGAAERGASPCDGGARVSRFTGPGAAAAVAVGGPPVLSGTKRALGS